MGAKPKKMGSAAKVPAKKKRAPARRVPARKAASKAGRTTREQSVEGYVAALDEELAEAARRLRQLIASAAPSATESFKWGQPVYEESGPFCYFKATGEHLTLGFWRGAELDDPDGRLEGDGDRMKHIKIRSADDIEEDAVADWVRQAVDLNRRFGSPTRQAQDVNAGGDGNEPADSRMEDDDDGAYASPSAPMTSVDDRATERYEDDDSFEPSWKDNER
jgi:hypothetical protein